METLRTLGANEPTTPALACVASPVLAEAIARRRFRPLLRLAWNPGIVLGFGVVGAWLWALGARAGWDFVYQAV